MTLTDSNGNSVTLGSRLGAGGEAQIFEVTGRGDLVAKIYHNRSAERTAKLQVMISAPPADPTAAQGHRSICWPSSLLFDPQRISVGFLMPRVDSAANLPIFQLCNPRDRQQVAPGFTWQYLLRTAANVASAVSAIHSRSYVIGDLNESNFLVSDSALVSLVDCDSMQVSGPVAGMFFRCPVGKPEFTPPELQGCDFGRIDRLQEHDNFGLGVLIFQLLMEGTHPFSGVWRGPGDPPPIEERIRHGSSPYAGAKSTTPMPGAPPFDILPVGVQSMFQRCFRDGFQAPGARPTPREWQAALATAESNLGTCAKNLLHVFSAHLAACPWCERTRLLGGLDPFPANPQQRPLKKATFLSPSIPSPTFHVSAGTTRIRRAAQAPSMAVPQASSQLGPPTPARLARGWAIALGCLTALLFANVVAPMAARIGHLVIPAASWLNLVGTGWFFATSALVGVTVTNILRANRKGAGATAVLAAVLALAFASLVGVADLAKWRSSPSGVALSGVPIKLEGQIIGSLSPATSVPNWLRMALGQRPITAENYPPPPDFQIRDRCAGEGCGYQRPWRALKGDVPLFAMWGQPTGEPVYTVADREVVDALAGMWIVKKPAVWEVLQPINIGGVDLHHGDLIYVLMNLGEGYVRGFFHGKIANFSPDIPGGASSGSAGSLTTTSARSQNGASVPVLSVASATDPTISKDFLGQATTINNIALGGTVVAPPYALQVWGNENGGGQALLQQSSSGKWTLRSSGGGLWDVQALMQKGVPRAKAERLIAGLNSAPAAIHHLSDDCQFVLWVQMKTGTGIIGWTNDGGYPSFDGQYKLFTYVVARAATEKTGMWDYELDVQAEKPSSLKIGLTVIPVTANSFAKVHTGYLLHAGETQSIELVANEDGELLAKTFVRPGTPVQSVSGSSATPAGQAPNKEGDQALGDLLGQARSLFENGQYEIALVRCNALLDKYPRNAAATDLKSKIEKAISILGRSTQAVASLQKQDALSAPPDVLQQAQTLFERGQYSVALSRCNDLVAKYPGDQKAIDLKRKIQTAIDVLKQ